MFFFFQRPPHLGQTKTLQLIFFSCKPDRRITPTSSLESRQLLKTDFKQTKDYNDAELHAVEVKGQCCDSLKGRDSIQGMTVLPGPIIELSWPASAYVMFFAVQLYCVHNCLLLSHLVLPFL